MCRPPLAIPPPSPWETVTVASQHLLRRFVLPVRQARPCTGFQLLQINHLCVFCNIHSPTEEEGNDVEVVWTNSACGVWGLGHAFGGKLYLTRDTCEEKWIPKDLAPPKKSAPAPKARAKPAPKAGAGTEPAAKPAPRFMPPQHSVPVIQTEHVQQSNVCYSRTRKFFIAVPITLVLHQ